MAAPGDSRCQRPAPNLAGGIFSPLCHQLGFAGSFSPRLHNSAVTCAPLVLPRGRCPALTWSFPGRSPLEVIPQAPHGADPWICDGTAQETRAESHGSHPELAVAFESLLEHKVPTNPRLFMTRYSGIQPYKLWPKNPSCLRGILLQPELCRKRGFASTGSTTVARW